MTQTHTSREPDEKEDTEVGPALVIDLRTPRNFMAGNDVDGEPEQDG